MTMLYQACQFTAKTPETRADEIIFRLRDLAETRGMPVELRTGYDDEAGLARIAGDAPALSIIHDGRAAMRSQYWFGFREEKKPSRQEPAPEPEPDRAAPAAPAITGNAPRPML